MYKYDVDNNLLIYKDYITAIYFDADKLVLHGKLENINDLITFESKSVNDIITKFHKAVDDYIKLQEEIKSYPYYINDSNMPSANEEYNFFKKLISCKDIINLLEGLCASFQLIITNLSNKDTITKAELYELFKSICYLSRKQLFKLMTNVLEFLKCI